MELFNDDGHLTGEGLQALMNETLDEMGRLEAAEHLSFCDECLLAYTDLLEGAALPRPARPMAAPVLRRLQRKGRRIAFSRYGTVAAAACLAVLMWGVSSFALPQIAQRAEQRTAAGTSVGERVGEFFHNASDGLGNLFGWIDASTPAVAAEDQAAAVAGDADAGIVVGDMPDAPAGEPQNPLVKEARRVEAERKEKERVFDRQKPAANDAEPGAGQDGGNS